MDVKDGRSYGKWQMENGNEGYLRTLPEPGWDRSGGVGWLWWSPIEAENDDGPWGLGRGRSMDMIGLGVVCHVYVQGYVHGDLDVMNG
jgi:hypothetical protein